MFFIQKVFDLKKIYDTIYMTQKYKKNKKLLDDDYDP